MIAIDPSLAILTAEILGAMVVVMLVMLFRVIFRNRGHEAAATAMIEHLNEGADSRREELAHTLQELRTDLNPKLLETALEELRGSENALYKQVLLLFLRRDPALIKELEQRVRGLYQPFCSIIEAIPEAAKEDPEIARALSQAEAEILWLKAENLRLSDQMNMARRTLDEVSGEYAKMFAGAPAKELELSRQRILTLFRDIEAGIRAPAPLDQAI